MISHFDIVDSVNRSKSETFNYPVSRTFTDSDGNILEWKFHKLDQNEIERIVIESKDPITEKENLFIACCAFPDLNDKNLQNSHKVNTPNELLYKLVPISEDWSKALKTVQENVLGTSVYEIADKIKDELCNNCDVSIMVRANALSELKILPSQYDKLSLIDKAYVLGVSMYKAKLLKKE